MGWMDETDARLTTADDDFASAGKHRDLSFKAARAGVSVNSSAKFIWRHRRRRERYAGKSHRTAPRRRELRAWRVRVIAEPPPSALPIMPSVAAMLAVLGVLLVVMGAFRDPAPANSTVAGMPAEYEADVIRAGSICQVVTPSIIAA